MTKFMRTIATKEKHFRGPTLRMEVLSLTFIYAKFNKDMYEKTGLGTKGCSSLHFF